MLSSDQSRRRATRLLSIAIKARDKGDEETADQLVLWASELIKQSVQQELAQPTRPYAHPLPDRAFASHRQH
jgi:hypothetical protein